MNNVFCLLIFCYSKIFFLLFELVWGIGFIEMKGVDESYLCFELGLCVSWLVVFMFIE